VILEVTAGGETLATTPGHPFWVLDVGWKDAGDLKVGDRLVNLRGESVVVEDIRRRPVPEAVYNFSVAGLHTYFVGQGGIWVHNNSGSGCAVPGGAGKAGDAAKAVEQGRDAMGRFLPKSGGEVVPGSLAEQAVWDAIKDNKPGWSVIEGRVSVRNSAGDLRIYDGAAVSPRVIGLEVKSGGATRTGPQSRFDEGVSTFNPAFGVGQSANTPAPIGRAILIKVP
jgi:Pretoxin HINT domain